MYRQNGAYDYAKSFIHALLRTSNLLELENKISIQDVKRADTYGWCAKTSCACACQKLKNMNFGIGILSNATTWHEVVIEKKIPLRELF